MRSKVEGLDLIRSLQAKSVDSPNSLITHKLRTTPKCLGVSGTPTVDVLTCLRDASRIGKHSRVIALIWNASFRLLGYQGFVGFLGHRYILSGDPVGDPVFSMLAKLSADRFLLRCA